MLAAFRMFSPGRAGSLAGIDPAVHKERAFIAISIFVPSGNKRVFEGKIRNPDNLLLKNGTI